MSQPSRHDLWIADLSAEIERKIDAAQARGIVGMTADCLWQNVWISSPHAPSGTNRAWSARSDFDELVATNKQFRCFVKG